MSRHLDIVTYLKIKRDRVNYFLDKYLPSVQTHPQLIHQAMRYSVLAGGKRLRPILALMSAGLLGGKEPEIMPAACALELIHTYSLIHDDLPALDNDNFRRGRPTCHKVFGEALAILTGDALLTLAFQLLAEKIKDPYDLSRLVREITIAAGSKGMIGGQVLDLIRTNPVPRRSVRGIPTLRPVEGEARLWRRDASGGLDRLKNIHRRKTTALIVASVRTGAIVAGAKPKELARLTNYGKYLGLAFQIIDDILDVEGTKGQLGKTPRKDISAHKLTYPSVLGIAQSRQEARSLIKGAKIALSYWNGQKVQPCTTGDVVPEADPPWSDRARRVGPRPIRLGRKPKVVHRLMKDLADYILNRKV